MGDIFLQYAPLLKVYSSYAQHVDLALEACAIPELAEFMTFAHKDPRVRGQTLQDLTLIPLERSHRYFFFMSEMRGLTPAVRSSISTVFLFVFFSSSFILFTPFLRPEFSRF
jgi:hypothetical protein